MVVATPGEGHAHKEKDALRQTGKRLRHQKELKAAASCRGVGHLHTDGCLQSRDGHQLRHHTNPHREQDPEASSVTPTGRVGNRTVQTMVGLFFFLF